MAKQTTVEIPEGLWREVEYTFNYQGNDYQIILGVDTNRRKDGLMNLEQFRGSSMAVDQFMSNVKSSIAYRTMINEYLIEKLSKEFKK